ncbi:beta strand repeat-containing protein [Bartonella schoenbuchensis]|uniref:beta strand repeat-containing protein n=1 Tax=Bartonella schoenbuchensis TaxID=165694 RepID=UPI0031455830
MVMRRVFNHHVCLCVLSTAILAGLALMASQTKVYAQAQNCKGLTGDRNGDASDKPIVCDGTDKGSGWRNGVGTLTGNRTIDMGVHSGVAVTITGQKAKITIKSTLTVRDSGGTGNNTTAIKVSGQGKLTVDNADVAEVQKGIVVENKGSSVTVVQGKIGVRAGGGPVIEVKNEGEVVFNRGVTVGTISESREVMVIENGGTLKLDGQDFKNVKTGIVVRGNGTANVKGGATITVKQGGGGGTGFKMQGTGTADVMELEIKGSGGNGTGAEVSSGTLKMTRVTLKDLATGAKVTGQGTLRMIGDSTITVGQNGTGVEVLSGTANVTSTTITLQGDGKGFKVNNGKVTMMSGEIRGNGRGMGATGLEMSGDANVTLMGVTMREVGTGITMTGGTLTLNGGTKIHVVAGGKGLDVTGSGNVKLEGTEIMAGNTGTGLNVGGKANVILTSVTMKEVGKGVEMSGGTLKILGESTITVGHNGTGMSVSKGNVVMTGTLTITGSGTTGMSVSNGTVTMEGKTTITVAAGGTGMSVTDGTVTMEGKTTITVAAGGTGMSVTDGTVTMKGGLTITASGLGTTGVSVGGGEGVWLTNVDISQFTTGITMTGGEKLTVEGGRIEGKGNSGVGIYAKSGSGNVTVEGVNISGFTTGINMTGTGGTLKLEGTTINVGRGGTGVYVGDKVQSTRLTGVTITKSGAGEGKGVEVKGGTVVMDRVGISNVGMGVDMGAEVKSAELTNVTITGVERGIYMSGKGTFTVSGTTTINFTGDDQYGYGVSVGERVHKAELTGVMIEGKGSGGGSKGVWVKGGAVVMNTVGISGVTTGVLMEEKVTNASLTGVTITGVKMGISMKGNGTFTVEKVGIQFEADGIGMYAGTSVTKATLTGVTIEGKGSGNGNGYGVLMTGSTVTMTRVNVSNVGTGVYATGSGELKVEGGEIKEVEKGIWVTGGTLIMKEGTKIQFTKDYGIKVGKSVSKAELMGVMIEGQNKGVGIYAEGKNLTVIGGEIKGVEDGIMMKGSGELKVRDNTKIWFTKDYGIKLGKGVTEASLTKVEIVGNNKGKGVVWESTGTLTLDEVKISGVGEGLYAVRGEALKVDGGSIGFTGTYGVMVGNAVTSATLTNVQIMGSNRGKTGVVMGSTGMLTSVNISGVQTGVEVAGSGKLTINEGTIGFTEVGLKVEGETTATATVTGTKIVGSGNSGVGIHGVHITRGGHVVLKDCMFISNLPFISHTTSFYSLYLFMFSCMFFLQCVSVLFIFSCFE